MQETNVETKKAAYLTLGCKLNFAETSTLSDQLSQMGIIPVGNGEVADVCVINTCSVTDTADQKCRQAIHKLQRQHPGALTIVMGCYAQLRPGEIAQFDGVDLVIGMEHKGEAAQRIADLLELRRNGGETPCHQYVATNTNDIKTFVPSCSRGNRTRYFLKVQDGCNYYCTYCTIPLARGHSRSGRIEDIVAQAQEAAANGGKEIVITGVNIGDFGWKTPYKLIDLLRKLDEVEGIERYRISSIEPNLLTDEIISFCAQSRCFMPHFHIPLQSGSDEVLKLMRRRYDTDFFRQKIEHVMEVRPDTFIGLDVIVGTRGELPEYFDASYRFIESLPIAALHVFSYSERPGTKAMEIPYVVSQQEKHARSERLIALGNEKKRAFYQRFAGQQRPILWEHGRTDRPMHGFTDNYIRVELPNGIRRPDNSITLETLGNILPDGSGVMADIK